MRAVSYRSGRSAVPERVYAGPSTSRRWNRCLRVPGKDRAGSSASNSSGARDRPARRTARRIQRIAGRQSVRRLRSLLVLLAILAFVASMIGIYQAVPPAVTSASSPAVNPITVELDRPVTGRVACGGSIVLYTEVIGWNHSSGPLTTAQVYVELQELYDHEWVGARDPPAKVTHSNLCAGSPPTGPFDWYVVLGSPDTGPYVAVFSYLNGWAPVEETALPVFISPGATLTLVSVRSYADSGFGITLFGAVGGTPIDGGVSL